MNDRAFPSANKPFEVGDIVYYDDNVYRDYDWTVSGVTWHDGEGGTGIRAKASGWWLEIDPPDQLGEQSRVAFTWVNGHASWKLRRRPDPLPEFPSTQEADSWLDRNAP